MKRKSWIVAILSILLIIVIVMAVSLGNVSKALSGSEKVDHGAVGTYIEGWVTVVISLDSNGKTYVSYAVVNAPEGCVVTSITIVVKGSTGEIPYTRDGSSASGQFYAPINNGGQRADVSHVTVYYTYYCPTPDPGTPDPGTPDPGTPDPGTPDPGTPDPGTPDPGTPDPGTPDPGTPTPNNSTPTPRITEKPVPGRG